MAILINKKDRVWLYRPYNEWDMNYHLIDFEEEKEYLIDIGDVYDNFSEVLEYGGILWEDLKNLHHVSEIKEWAWKARDN